MYFLVNASPLKPLDVATSKFADALTVRSKAVICDGVPSNEVLFKNISSFEFYLACSTELVSVLVDCYLQTYSFLPSGQLLGKKALGNYTSVSFNCSQTNHK